MQNPGKMLRRPIKKVFRTQSGIHIKTKKRVLGELEEVRGAFDLYGMTECADSRIVVRAFVTVLAVNDLFIDDLTVPLARTIARLGAAGERKNTSGKD